MRCSSKVSFALRADSRKAAKAQRGLGLMCASHSFAALRERVLMMFMRLEVMIGLVCGTILIGTATVRAQLTGGPYAIQPLDINGGGTTSTGGPYSISASTAQPGGVGTIIAEPVPAPPLYQLDDGFWSTTAPCNDPTVATGGSAACHDNDVCTCDECIGGSCAYRPIHYGDANCAGPVNQANLDDILCVLTGFANFAACVNGDLHPPCTGNNSINLDDILALLAAFAGADECSCGR